MSHYVSDLQFLSCTIDNVLLDDQRHEARNLCQNSHGRSLKTTDASCGTSCIAGCHVSIPLARQARAVPLAGARAAAKSAPRLQPLCPSPEPP